MQNQIVSNIQLINEQDVSTFITTDGREVIVRPILESDAELLVGLFYRLSTDSIRLRFHTSASHLVPPERIWQEAKRLTHLDPECQAALIAIGQERDKAQAVGVARFCRAKPQDVEAEAAIVIRDDFQRVGLGTYLGARLIRVARSMGIQCFVAWILAENRLVLELIKKSGLPFKQKVWMGEIQAQISLI
jgi:GNAT superfamily N-acetyltransferase